MNTNSIQKTPEQQIDEAVENLKALFLPQARNKQEADEIKRRLDSLGHEAKAVPEIVNDRDIYKAAIHKIILNNRLFYSQDFVIVSNSKLKWFNGR